MHLILFRCPENIVSRGFCQGDCQGDGSFDTFQNCQGDGSFDTFQKYIFALLNRHQRLKELVFSNFSTSQY